MNRLCERCDAPVVLASGPDDELLELDAVPSPVGSWVLDGLATFLPPGTIPTATAVDGTDGRVRWRTHTCPGGGR